PKLVPRLYRYLDDLEVATLAMPAALLVINGKKDQLFDLDGVQQSFDKIESCHKKAGIKDKVRTRFYDTPHEFNNEMQAEAWEWLRKWVLNIVRDAEPRVRLDANSCRRPTASASHFALT